ncbi:MAG: hypothetical protein WBQ41_01445 [Solirubrobacterales bacterium]
MAASEPSGAEVWPRVERSEQVRTDSKGRIKTQNRWELVLENTGHEPARHVHFRLEPENEEDEVAMLAANDPGELEVFAPRSDASYLLIMSMGVAEQARCVVSWEDSAGEHENIATLRFF